MIASPAATKKGGKCEGTKQERKQKIEPRTLTESQLATLATEYGKVLAAERAGVKRAIFGRLEHERGAHLATGAPFVHDILVISGGGAKGAFGAGFLEGWGTVADGPMARPELDMVTGVSTGALIAPYAFIGRMRPTARSPTSMRARSRTGSTSAG